MSDEKPSDRTRAGLFGDIAGKTKETIGELVGNESLADDGREQQAEVEADERDVQARADSES